MTQLVEFKDGIVQRVEVKVGGDYIRICLFSGMLNRREADRWFFLYRYIPL